MKYTRLEPIKKAANSKIKILVGFVIVIPITAILVGSIITRFVILPFAIKNASAAPSNTRIKVAASIKKREFSVYILQAGAFANPDNANVLKNAILGIGEKTSIINDNKIYRVIVDISENKDSIIKTKDKLSQNGYGCLINEMKIGQESKDSDLSKYLDSVTAVLYKQINGEKKHSESEKDSIKKAIEEVEKSYTLIMNSDVYSRKGKEISAFNKELITLMNGFLKDYEMETDNGFKYISEELILVKNFYKSIEDIEANSSV